MLINTPSMPLCGQTLDGSYWKELYSDGQGPGTEGEGNYSLRWKNIMGSMIQVILQLNFCPDLKFRRKVVEYHTAAMLWRL